MHSIEIGDLVEVLRSKYKEVPIGAIGTVRSIYDASVTVIFTDIHNPRSSYDCFYFTKAQLKHYKGETTMEGNYRIANVKFIDGTNANKTYRYALYDEGVVTGDTCVVKTAHHGLSIARIESIEPKTDEKLTREIVCKCDFSAYNKREETRERKAALKRKMAARAAQLQEIAIYKMMADSDAGMADMLKEYDELEDC